jgi:hypothetical protein
MVPSAVMAAATLVAEMAVAETAVAETAVAETAVAAAISPRDEWSAHGSMTRIQATYLALISAQALHFIEEYVGRLYLVFPPARFVSGLLSADLRRGFLIANLALLSFGLLCFVGPIRGRWPSATVLLWFWVILETINGLGHPLWSLLQGRYTPGTATAPLLFGIAVYLARQLRQAPPA